MNEVYLKDGRTIFINDEDSIRLAKYIILLPDFKVFEMGGVSMRIKDLDFEKKRLSKYPQQTTLGIRTKVIDK